MSALGLGSFKSNVQITQQYLSISIHFLFLKVLPDATCQVERYHPLAAVWSGRSLHLEDGPAGCGMQRVQIKPDAGGRRLHQKS